MMKSWCAARSDIEAYFELAREGEDVLADLERDINALSDICRRP